MAESEDKHDVCQTTNVDAEESSKKGDASSETETQSTSEWMANMMRQSLSLKDPPVKLLDEVTFEGVASYINSDKCKNVIVMAGAGISTSAGIPDFRSPGTGLYDNLQKYNLSNPTDIFNISFFKENPEPFFQLAKELWPGHYKPTPSHYFVRLVGEKGLLLRHFTQNIDSLERLAGIDEARLTEAHGTFHTSHCLECRKEYSQAWIKEKIFADGIPHCSETDCEGVVKPDIVFFGEPLPSTFFNVVSEDLPKCDMLIIMGTSLWIQPFASLAERVPETTPRLYINLENEVGDIDPFMALLGMGVGFKFGHEDNYRDVFWQGKCDDGCQALADLLGWGEDLKKLVQSEHAKLDAEEKAEVPKGKQAKAS